MASISSLSSFTSLRGGRAPPRQFLLPRKFVSFRSLRLGRASVTWPSRPLREKNAWKIIVRAVAEGEILAQEAESVPAEPRVSSGEDTVSVPISPSDVLTLFFKAEGTMDETTETKVSKALEEVDGISDLKVLNAEGIASVERIPRWFSNGVGRPFCDLLQQSSLPFDFIVFSDGRMVITANQDKQTVNSLGIS
ncbi:hypothetical protein HPP92_014416 [Vanilla planifolia]|uniref:Uncharacterized protein n=1 Tax=Vanilla planifolia TaxID=51239 RepID=A0A835UV74_VANPL|nr:hypothetical protein HPP92_014818 [Vanilla planifolia]KAG0474730.1 hypothetical protein HPP92_014416 [Vanilla planifolia]